MNRLADGFEGAVGRTIETVSAAGAELETAAGTLNIVLNTIHHRCP
jgi:hypothetical protein